MKKVLLDRILASPTASVPDTGAVFDLGRNASYQAAKNGEIPTLHFGNKRRVPTAWIRSVLGLPIPDGNSRRDEAVSLIPTDQSQIRRSPVGTDLPVSPGRGKNLPKA